MVLVEANGRIEGWRYERSSMHFSVRAHVPLRFSLANISACRVEGDGRALTGTLQGAITRYELNQNGIDRVAVACPS